MKEHDNERLNGSMQSSQEGSSDDERELPKLCGPKKLKRWSYQVRSHYQVLNPNSELLEKETSVEFWIDNRVRLIGDVVLPKTYPRLTGGSDGHQRWAVAIRSRFAETFPESRLLYSQTQAKFWIENRKIFDFAIHGYNATVDEVGTIDSD